MNRILASMILWIALLQTAPAVGEAEKEESQRNEMNQVNLWEKKLEASRGKPDNEKMSELWLGLRNMGYRNSRHNHISSVTNLYKNLQSEILSIPGHAEYYSAPIWESYKAYRDPSHPKHSGSAVWFMSEARYGLDTLKHLPSAETVKVLGEMLREEWEPEMGTGPEESDMTYPSAMAYQATWTLGDLPLRDKPSPPFERNQAEDYLPAWQKWYDKVKSGEIPFSFVGQPVEYRFQSDGVIFSTPLRISNEKRKQPESTSSEQKNSDEEITKESQSAGRSSRQFAWLWIGAAVALLIAILGFFTMRKTSVR